MVKKRNRKMSLVIALFLLAIVSTAGAKIIYIDADVSPGGDGQTWETAYKYLQDGLGVSVFGDQIWVAGGIYKPDANAGNPTGTGDRFATFELKNGVAIKGGYAGFGEPNPNARDIEVYETVLSGDLRGSDKQGLTLHHENSYHVVTGSGTNDTAVLDGFTIAVGNANGSNQHHRGGGMYNNNGSPTLTNCIFYGNLAVLGGGMGNDNFSNPTLTNCTFSGNRAGLGGQGGGMANRSSSPTLINCTFSGNSAQWDGGGMWNYNFSNPTLTNCLFIGNSPDHNGGGVNNWLNCSPTLTNCTFSGNSAGYGGGMANWENCRPTLTHCIFWGNTVSQGGSQIHNGGGCSTTVSYSDVQGGWPGETNMDADPCFADPDNGDCHLRSEAGRWDPLIEDWVVDDVTSPCIDRGDPIRTVGDELMPNGGIINMGAYGGTAEASMSIGTLPPFLPTAHWTLDEADGTIAYDSAGENDAGVFGGAIWQPTSGKVNGALEFDGIDDYIRTPFVFNPAGGAFRVVVWIKGGAPGQAILSQVNGVNWLCMDSVDGCLITELIASGRDRGSLRSQTVIADGEWHRTSLVWDGAYRHLYVDGVEVAIDAAPSSALESAEGGLYFGADSALASGTFFSGLIDDIRIYSRAVSP